NRAARRRCDAFCAARSRHGAGGKTGRMRRLKRMFGAVFLLYLGYGVVMTVVHPSMIYPFAGEPFERSGYAHVVLETPDGDLSLQVHEGADDAPVVLMFMGNSGTWAWHTALLEPHEALDQTIIAVEYPGGGGVPGSPSEGRLKREALVAADYALALGKPVIVHGYSLGTGLAVHVAAQREVAGVILDAPYARLCDIMTTASALPACYMPFVHKWRSFDEALLVDEPVLIRHGTRDQVVPFAQGKRLAPAFGDHVTFVAIEGKGHGTMHESPTYGEAGLSFMTRILAN
ncbi:MAG: alpha/beta hydrolase, partial [Deltaproteobacteria bacterium]